MSDADTGIGFVTPSFYGDLEQCALLCESIEKFCTDPYRHYLLIDRVDVDKFKALGARNTEIIAKEDLLPGWVSGWRMPLPRKNRYVRLSLKSRPIRGWIAQQMVKLSAVAQLRHEHVVMVDSDVFLLKPFSAGQLVRNGLSPLYAKPGAIRGGELEFGRHVEWQRVSESVLGLPPADEPFVDFIT
ncbi:MAG: DUF6492 family protein, partial [Caulobacterales bacterium]|nr:DUF6492 family protein [Caulobacterales bacterium]